jgi:hypothetical protein
LRQRGAVNPVVGTWYSLQASEVEHEELIKKILS